ncbi:MAG: chromosomal replication initiator protein DnaA [Firmicutes bacterium]|nr:chromosomal replication initiator protein DnaA [Clostridia bacterium]MBS6463762.1 chromosomal replication initiator protein DnaA [Bacillota bacterium]
MEYFEILWNNALGELEKTVSSISYATFIETITPIDIQNNKLILMTPSEHFANAVNGRLGDKVRDALARTNSGITDFSLFIGDKKEKYFEEKNERLSSDLPSSPIDPKLTFDSFVVGDSNRFICAAAKAVAEAPGEAYNPLFIYGGTGLGKTHILMAIANYIKIHNPSVNVVYATCEQFTNQLIESISRGKNDGAAFRSKYRNVDVLLLDDVQFLAKKPGTQMEFFHTFNELVLHNKQIVLTSDRSPKEIEVLEDRLRTRFEGGLLADVQPPDMETRIAILKRKAEERKCMIDMGVLTYLAENSEEDIRTLIGKLTKVIFASKLHEKPITVELAREALKESIASSQEEIEVDDIIKCTCDFFHISKSDLLGKKKNKEFVEPRQICIYLITDLMSLPLMTIGQKMGGRDHTTVIYARDKVAELINTNPRVATQVDDLKNMLLKK